MTEQNALPPVENYEPRLITETGVDARIASIVEPVINGAGYVLCRVRLSGLNGLTLQIMVERPDGTMTVSDCEEVSRMLSPLLDVEDPVERQYYLEVSTPGIDRPLVRKSDFKKWSGHIVKLETSRMVENRKRFRGNITEVTDAAFTLVPDKATYGENSAVVIPFDAISDARLILTDELIRDSLKADKAARIARGETVDDDLDNNDNS
ncbi:ribosome maturation factor RimP [Ahrensia marina]|uniref:Ribosome maturation factor RimP n=1 Tax=Ahrensia marina TaxID=1514904 RepID=A0A0N0E863_9HYPH|nr:ribosome maturation factor RimP [Ahrensia marina]KPB01992.1 ribosome maturation factor RimP [Ahrensia marina]